MILALQTIAAVLDHAGPSRDSQIHGEDHWRKVAIAGLRIVADERAQGLGRRVAAAASTISAGWCT